MRHLTYKKHKTQDRFFDYQNRTYVDIHQIALDAIKAKAWPLIIDHSGKDITKDYVFSGKKAG